MDRKIVPQKTAFGTTGHKSSQLRRDIESLIASVNRLIDATETLLLSKRGCGHE